MKQGHEYKIVKIECECGYEGYPDYHDHWVWNAEHPIQGPVTLRDHQHNEMLQKMGEIVRSVYEPQLRAELSVIPMLRRGNAG